MAGPGTLEEEKSYQPVRAPRGTSLSCKGWQTEAALMTFDSFMRCG